MVVQDQTELFLDLNHHPVCAASDAVALSSYWRSHPSWPGGERSRLSDSSRTMITVVDYKLNNLRSIENTLRRLGHDVQVTSDPKVVQKARS